MVCVDKDRKNHLSSLSFALTDFADWRCHLQSGLWLVSSIYNISMINILQVCYLVFDAYLIRSHALSLRNNVRYVSSLQYKSGIFKLINLKIIITRKYFFWSYFIQKHNCKVKCTNNSNKRSKMFLQSVASSPIGAVGPLMHARNKK